MEKTENWQGIILMGTWLVDIVKFIDEFPKKGNLTTIRSITMGGGGCSHNVMIDLAKLQTGLPLYAGGLVGDDDHGRYLLGELERSGIDARHMTVTDRAATSYTDVMTETHGGARTFFHYRGACALLGPEHFEPVEVPARIFHLGYLLLDRMDEPDPGYGRQAAREGLQDLGRRGLGAGQPFP